MIACSFDESNAVLNKPSGVPDAECEALSVLKTQTESGQPVIISLWKLTVAEEELFAKTKRVWLTVWGNTMAPSMLSAEKPFTVEGG